MTDAHDLATEGAQMSCARKMSYDDYRARGLEAGEARPVFKMLTCAARIIGFKRGTGGASAAQDLRRVREVDIFPERWQVRGRS